MIDHEAFVLLAAKQISEPLTRSEASELEGHLAVCRDCAAIAAEMRRDDIRLHAILRPRPVSPRVRQRVRDEAAGKRRFDSRLILGLAAAVLLTAVGVPLITGSKPPTTAPAPTATEVVASPAEVVSPFPRATDAAVATIGPVTGSPAPSATQTPGFVAGAYTYGATPSRRDSITAHFDGGPVGEWSRRIPSTGAGDSFGGPVTCLVISGRDAWLAGPATTATDGSKDRAALIYVHDGGREGKGDTAVLWLSTVGQTITTMTGWCQSRFIPAGPFPLTSGDVVVTDRPS
jgi:hypothetical protein